MKLHFLPVAGLLVGSLHAQVTFGWKEMLGRVTDHSVAVTAVPDKDAEIAVSPLRFRAGPANRS